LISVTIGDVERERIVLIPLLAERGVLIVLDEVALPVGKDVRRAEMVGVVVPEDWRAGADRFGFGGGDGGD
jgi:hypothetical protein